MTAEGKVDVRNRPMQGYAYLVTAVGSCANSLAPTATHQSDKPKRSRRDRLLRSDDAGHDDRTGVEPSALDHTSHPVVNCDSVVPASITHLCSDNTWYASWLNFSLSSFTLDRLSSPSSRSIVSICLFRIVR